MLLTERKDKMERVRLAQQLRIEIMKLAFLNEDEFEKDENYEEFKSYLRYKGLSEEEVGKIVDKLSFYKITLYKAREYDFYEEFDIFDRDFDRLLKKLYEAYREVVKNKAHYYISFVDNGKYLIYDFMKRFYPLTEKRLLKEEEKIEGIFVKTVKTYIEKYDEYYAVVKYDDFGGLVEIVEVGEVESSD